MSTYSLHHYCLRWMTLECRPYTAPLTKEVSREVVHNTGTCTTQCQRWRTKTTNSGTMLCKTSPSRCKTVPEHHKTQEELDAETFPEFTSPVVTELTDKEKLRRLKRSPLNPNQPNTQSMLRRKIGVHLRKTNHYPRHQPINQWPLHLRHESKYFKLLPRGNSVFIFIFCTAYLD
jgi:hypothetical protein